MTEPLTIASEARAPAASRALRSGIGWVSASMLASAAINYGYTLGLAHLLDASAYTVFAAGQAILLVMGTMSGAAAPWLLAYEIARRPDDRQARRDAVAFTITLDLVLGVVAAGVVLLVSQTFADVAVSLTLALGTVVIFLSSAAVGYLQGEGRYGALAGYRAVEVVLKAVSGVIAVVLGAGAIGGLAGFLISDFVMLLIGCWIMRADLSIPTGVIRARALWRRSLGLGGVQGLIAAVSNIDTILVAIVSRDVNATAAYQLASTLSRAPVFYSTAVSTVAFREMNVGDDATSHRAARRCLSMFALPALGLALVTATAPDPVVRLVAPSAFGSLTSVLPFTAATGLALGLINLYATFFQARLRFAVPVAVLAAGSCLVAVGVVVGNGLDGVDGLAAGTTLAVGVLTAGWIAVSRRDLSLSVRRGTAALGTVVACVALAALVLTRGSTPAWLAVAVVIGALLLRAVMASGRRSSVPAAGGSGR